MGEKIYFQDGSAIEISTDILEPGEMATVAYRRVIEFINTELKNDDSQSDDELGGLSDDDFEELDGDDLVLDDDDEDELELEDDWEDDDDFADRW